MSTSEDPLAQFIVGSIPTAYYVPNYISVDEEQILLKKVRNIN